MYLYIRRKIIMATSKDTKKEAVVVEEVKAVEKAPAKKETAKTTEKKAPAKKAATKKTETAEKKVPAKKAETTTKKETVKKPAVKKPAMKVNMHVQFSDKDYEAETIYEMAVNDYVAAGNKKTSIKNLEAYVKAEDNKVYYVINGDYRGEVSL